MSKPTIEHDYAKCGAYDVFGVSLCPACSDGSIGRFLITRIGELLDTWDQLPNDILKLDELDAVSRKIAELRHGMEVTK